MEREMTSDSGQDKKFTVSIAEDSQCKRTLSFAIPEDVISEERQVVANKLRRELRVPGFRKGKVPITYVEKNYGEVVHSDAVRNLLPLVFHEAIHEHDLRPIGDPIFDNLGGEPGQGVTFDAKIEIRPDVTVAGWDKVKVSVEKEAIGDDRVEETVANLREQFATLAVVDRAAGEKDFVIIDYAPIGDEGQPVEDKFERNQTIDLTNDRFLPEFRDNLVGMTVGEEKNIEVNYPDDFPDEALRGQMREFKIAVKEVKEKLLPELDEAFAQRVNPEFENIEALTTRIKDDLEAEADKRWQRDVDESIFDQLIDMNPFEVPEVMVENYLHSLVHEDQHRRPNVPDEAQREREIREVFGTMAEKAIKRYFVIDAVQRQQGFEVGEDDISERLTSLAERSGRDLDQVKSLFGNPEQRGKLVEDMMEEKVLNFLREQADIKK